MSVTAAILSAAVAMGPFTVATTEADPTPIRCRPAPFYVTDTVQKGPAVARLALQRATLRLSAPPQPIPCYLTRGGRPGARQGRMLA